MSVQPRLLKSMKSGMSVTVVGTMIVARSSVKSSRFPRPDRTANAYPTREEEARVPSTVRPATSRVLRKKRGKSSSLQPAAKFSSVAGSGIQVGGLR